MIYGVDFCHSPTGGPLITWIVSSRRVSNPQLRSITTNALRLVLQTQRNEQKKVLVIFDANFCHCPTRIVAVQRIQKFIPRVHHNHCFTDRSHYKLEKRTKTETA
ncbi:hypothetical protein CEXT_320631 [Caerostris extrusa]|uniref:Transposase n=1 Tax=Caerostris extrusa TaxID=172846 RepID=A0AAV4WH88_CAEEX|nr:hypothetical protein CEXT_320631 [Caerostris extrusa]